MNDTNYRERLGALIEGLEQQPGRVIPCSDGRHASEIASWIRAALTSEQEIADTRRAISRLKAAMEAANRKIVALESVVPTDERKLVEQLQKAGTRLGNDLGKAQREVRDIALDRDRWRKRAREAEAAISSAGIETKQHNSTSLDHTDQAWIGL
jgi:hypothetical protein